MTDADKVTGLLTAINWVLNDACYKAPEQIGDVCERWIHVLKAAKEKYEAAMPSEPVRRHDYPPGTI